MLKYRISVQTDRYRGIDIIQNPTDVIQSILTSDNLYFVSSWVIKPK